ncbi:hypothetical protein [Photobacterium jeanii]|nr:hypothetical protein [Photobacterium jeanii]
MTALIAGVDNIIKRMEGGWQASWLTGLGQHKPVSVWQERRKVLKRSD